MIKKTILSIAISLMSIFVCIGYATIVDKFDLSGNIVVEADEYDVYITSIVPISSAGVMVTSTIGTMMVAMVTSSGTARFTVNVINVSDKIYVYERVIDGAETNIDGIYSGTEITYKVSKIASLDEVAPNGGTRSFEVEISVPQGVTANQYVLLFNFIEKQDIEILPDGTDPDEPGDSSSSDSSDSSDSSSSSSSSDSSDSSDSSSSSSSGGGSSGGGTGDDLTDLNFRGLVEILLDFEVNNSLNNSNMIYKAVMNALESGKRPKEDAPIVHCSVNSVSGGTMSDLAHRANEELTEELQFLFEVDPTNKDRLFLYMYHAKNCTSSAIGSEILVYKQVVVRDSTGEWVKGGTYVGRATVGWYYGGGNNSKDVLTINTYSWKAGAPEN